MLTLQFHDLQTAAACVEAGGIIAYPTEGVIGLGCDPFCRSSVERLLQLKNRSASQGLIVVCSDLETARGLVATDDQKIWGVAASVWPGPTTLLLPAAKRVPTWITGGRDKVALRVPSFHPLVSLARACNGCLVSTSANVSGHPPQRKSVDLDPSILRQIDGVLEGGVGEFKGATSIVDAETGEVVRASR